MPVEGVMTNRIRVRYRCPPLTARIPTPYPTAAPDTHSKRQQLRSAPNMCPRKPGHPGSILGCHSTRRRRRRRGCPAAYAAVLRRPRKPACLHAGLPTQPVEQQVARSLDFLLIRPSTRLFVHPPGHSLKQHFPLAQLYAQLHSFLRMRA